MAFCRVQPLLSILLLLGLCTCRADQTKPSVLVTLQPGSCVHTSEGTFIQYQATFFNKTGKPYHLIPATKPSRLYSTLSIRVERPQQAAATLPLYFPSDILRLTIPAEGHFTLPLQILIRDATLVMNHDSVCQLLRLPFSLHAQDTLLRILSPSDAIQAGRSAGQRKVLDKIREERR
ncbi:hypothetical protein ACW9KT_21785 [Hymenobacter sp. HD11105]